MIENKIKRRNTFQRNVIYNILCSTTSHPTADWIYEKARKEIPNISLGTVYRNLKILKEEGKIIEINDGKQSRFDAKVEPHHHFKCEVCGNIYDIEPDNILSLNSYKLTKEGYIVKDATVMITGVCPSCNKETS